jgi:cyclic dehypoxanthinyl futalosine synthase
MPLVWPSCSVKPTRRSRPGGRLEVMGISSEQALDCFLSDDLIGIGMEADAIRRRLHPEGVVTYIVDCRIALTDKGAPRSIAAISEEIGNALELGVNGVHLTNPPLTIAALEETLRALRQRFPSVWLHGLSASQIATIANHSGLTSRDTLACLQSAGLNSLAGDDALILSDEFRSGPACTAQQWLETHRAAHQLGLRSTTGITIGLGETPAQRVHHLSLIRDLQSETGGFTAFLPTCFQPADRATSVHGRGEPTAVEYLKTLAIARMALDTIPNLQSSTTVHGLKVLQMALRFGGNDAGSIFGSASEEDLRRIIRDAGFRPAQRDTPYRTLFLN